jgi:soluble lytic murein transglycosylase
LSRDDELAKQAIGLIRHGKFADARALASSISDPVAQKLVEWVLLRNSDSTLGFDRYQSFIQANPGWPSIPLLRRRAETRLWQAQHDANTVRRFVEPQPASVAGRLALARVQLKAGDRTSAEHEVRAIWHSAEISAELETVIVDRHRKRLPGGRLEVEQRRRTAAIGAEGRARRSRLCALPPALAGGARRFAGGGRRCDRVRPRRIAAAGHE